MKYYNNDEVQGVIFDWEQVKREWDKLKVPYGYYNPLNAIAHGARWNIAASTRSVGKTTQVLLLGMILNKLYGTQICYVRSHAKEANQLKLETLFNVICGYQKGRYIKDITGGYYNSVCVHWRKIYYCLRDDNGEILERMDIPLMHCLTADEHLDYKSTFNCPQGDLIIWDEAIGDRYDNDFYKFCDLQKTIGRDRKSMYIFVLANTTDITAPLWRELEINKEVRTITAGHGRLCYTSAKMPIWVEMLDVLLKESRSEYNELYLGFDNPKLDAITGNNTGWSFECVPHIEREDKQILNRDNCISYHGDLLAIDLVQRRCINQIIIEIHPITVKRKYCYVLDTLRAQSDIYGMPRGVYNLLLKFRDRGCIYFSDNMTGHIYKQFLQEVSTF